MCLNLPAGIFTLFRINQKPSECDTFFANYIFSFSEFAVSINIFRCDTLKNVHKSRVMESQLPLPGSLQDTQDTGSDGMLKL